MERREELLHEILEGILDSSKLQGIEGWEMFSLVVGVSEKGSAENYGITFCQDGEMRPFSVSGRISSSEFSFYDLVREFRSEIQVEGQGPWKKMLIQFRAADGKFKMQFEYDDDGRWSVSPATYRQDHEALRPVFDE